MYFLWVFRSPNLLSGESTVKNTRRLAASCLSLALVSLVVVGCKSAPVYNVQDAAIASGTTKADMADIQKAIVRAGSSLGWQMKAAGPGSMIGTLYLRKHVAVVDIRYNTKTYSILYKESQNLDYDGANIHSNYNGWIQNLNRAIQTQLSTL